MIYVELLVENILQNIFIKSYKVKTISRFTWSGLYTQLPNKAWARTVKLLVIYDMAIQFYDDNICCWKLL